VGRHPGNVVGDLTRLLRWGTATGDNDDRLLERFLADGDESAFAALVARHGPMVLGVCRRVLHDGHDVEDAFQATFLVLARNARTIRRSQRVGPWLHGVARRVAVRARENAARRLARERIGIDVEPAGDSSSSRDPERIELRAILDEELNGLPERLRAPLVLCYLEGLTHDQAASRLSQPVGTIRSRLSRGRERLRVRLTRRGVQTDDAVLGSAAALETVSPALLETTVRSALEFAVSQTGASALASAGAVALAKGVLNTMMISKLTLTAACALALVLTAGGLSGYAFQQDAGTEQAEAEPEAANDAPKDGSNPLSDVKSQLEEIQRSMNELEDQRQKYNESLSSVVKRLDDLREQLERAAEKTEPEAELAPDLQAVAADGKNRPRYLPTDRPVVVPSEDGHVVTIFPIPMRFAIPEGDQADEMKKMRAAASAPISVRIAEAGSPRLDVLPRFTKTRNGQFLIALALRGEKIQRLAVFDPWITNTRGVNLVFTGNRWVVQDLTEPVMEAAPVVGQGVLAYVLDNRIYTYCFGAGKWNILELPEGARPEAPEEGFNGLRLEYDSIIYSYDRNSDDWAEIDTRAVPEAEKPEE